MDFSREGNGKKYLRAKRRRRQHLWLWEGYQSCWWGCLGGCSGVLFCNHRSIQRQQNKKRSVSLSLNNYTGWNKCGLHLDEPELTGRGGCWGSLMVRHRWSTFPPGITACSPTSPETLFFPLFVLFFPPFRSNVLKAPPHTHTPHSPLHTVSRTSGWVSRKTFQSTLKILMFRLIINHYSFSLFLSRTPVEKPHVNY